MKIAHNPIRIYRWADIPKLAGLAIAYALLAKGVLDFFWGYHLVRTIWPPSGLALGALLLGGKKYWPGILAGAFASNYIAGGTPWMCLMIACGNTLAALAAVWLLERSHQFSIELARLRDYFWLCLAAAVSACISALTGSTALLLAGFMTQQSMLHHLFNWWQGDVLGVVLLTPLILIWRKLPKWFGSECMIEAAICFALAWLLGQILYLGWFFQSTYLLAHSSIIFLLIVWSAVRFGRHGVLLMVSIITVQALLGAIQGVGYFANDIVLTGLTSFWLYILVLAVVGMTLAVIFEERKQIEERRSYQLRYLNAMEHISHIGVTAQNMEEMLKGVLEQILSTFSADRAWFLYPCDPDVPSWHVPMERTRPEWPGIFAQGRTAVMTDEVAGIFRSMLTAKGVVQYGPEENSPVPSNLAENFSIKSQLMVVLRPKIGSPWLLGLHHCSHALHHDKDDQLLFNDIALRISDSLNSLISFQHLRDSGERFRHMLEHSPIGVRITDIDGHRVLFANKRYSQMFNIPRDQVIGTDPRDLYAYPMDYAEVLLRLSMGETVNDKLVEYKIGGKPFWAFASFIKIAYENESAILGWFYDVTELKNASEDQQLAALVYQNSSQAMMVTDADGKIITINPAFTETTGYTLEEVFGKSTKILSSGRQDAAFFKAMWDTLLATGQWQGEIWNRRKNGELYLEWLTINTIYGTDGLVYRRVALFSDITKKKEAEETIWKQANFDPLTQLPNRRMFHDRLEQEIKKSHRTGLPMALLFLDLDHFKEVNDTLGHSMGDTLLLEVAMRILTCVRESDTVARLGGDEFTVILGELDDVGSVERVAQGLLQSLSAPFQLGNETTYVSASIGITLYPDDAVTAESLIKNADQAMYAAKNQGRNQFSYFTYSMQEAARTRMRLANDLRNALLENQFWIAYQPIVDLATGDIHKAEALIRWQHPEFGLVSPAAFIPLAEETRLIIDIGDWVFQTAARQNVEWRASFRPDFEISINKSPVQFLNDGHSHASWPDQMKSLGLPGESIVVEITEGVLLDATAIVSEKLLEYRDHGIQVAVDDFGTGYSSLSYIKKFHIDYLKIDQSFVRNLTANSNDMVLCEAIIVMAHKLGIKVIAEGIETDEQRHLLAAIGCDYGQGYLFSQPVPADEFEKLLRLTVGGTTT